MVNWLILLTHQCKNSTQTFFQTVQIMDNFMLCYDYSLSEDDITYVGAIAFSLASRVHDVNTVSLGDAHTALL